MKHFLIGLQFLTRLKLAKQNIWELEDFGKSVPYFPLIGLVIGIFSALLYVVFFHTLGAQLTALLVIVFQFLFTGGLHADGYMDTCDGLFSGRDRERKLEIMKDSRIGSNGVVGFVFLVLLKWQLLAMLPIYYGLPFLIYVSVLSKYGMTMSICSFPYARPEGMGKAFAQFAPKHTLPISLLYTIIGMFIAVVVSLQSFFFYAVGLLLLTVFINQVLNRYITKHLGGTTGDTYGFVSELTELILTLIFAILISLANGMSLVTL